MNLHLLRDFVINEPTPIAMFEDNQGMYSEFLLRYILSVMDLIFLPLACGYFMYFIKFVAYLSGFPRPPR